MFNVFKQSLIYTMHNLYSFFLILKTCNIQKLHCFEISHTTQCYNF